MIKSYDKKRNEGCNLNETFQYQERFIALVAPMENLVTSDCEGDWNRHLNAVQSILTIFALFDCVNYLHWCPLYTEYHQALLEGQFVVKRTRVKFKTVAADQSLKQTINQSQKSSGRII